MPTVQAPADETVNSASLVNPLCTPIARAMLDNGFDMEAVIEWQSMRAARESVRSEAWFLGQE